MLIVPVTPSVELVLTRPSFHWDDPFHPDMPELMRRSAERRSRPCRGSPHRLGYAEAAWLDGWMTKEEMREIYGLATRMREIRQAAAARSITLPSFPTSNLRMLAEAVASAVDHGRSSP